MKEISSTTFVYHDATYELVKCSNADVNDWRVYKYSINGRGQLATSFTDLKFNDKQAVHVAMHKLSAYALGKKDGQMLKQRFGATG